MQELDEGEFCPHCLIEYILEHRHVLHEAEYKGRKVQLGKPMAGDVKKFKVYVKNNKGNVVDRKSTRLNSSHVSESRMPSSA